MTRMVGQHDRSEFEMDPVRAFWRGRRLDFMLKTTQLPVERGVLRKSHRALNELDDLRALNAARRINSRR